MQLGLVCVARHVICTMADKCHPSNFHYVCPFSKFTPHFIPPLSKLTCSPSRSTHDQMMLWLIKESWIMDARRKTHTPSLGVAGAAGNTASLIAPLTFIVDIFTDPGCHGGVRRLERVARRGGLGSDTTVARSRPAVGHPTCWHVII